MTDLYPLDVDKNEILKSKIDSNLVRTGTISEGSCFFHSVLKGLSQEYSKNYDGSVSTKAEKKEKVRKLREEVSESISMSSYLSLFEGNLAKLEFSENVHRILKEFYEFVNNTDKFIKDNPYKKFLVLFIKKNISQYKIITSLIDYEEMDRIQSSVFDKCSVLDCGNTLIEQLSVQVEEETLEKLRELIDIICDTSLTMALEKYKEKLKDCGMWADNTMFKLVSDYLDVDIYILTEETGLPYFIPGNMTSGRRNAVIVGSIGGGHFENIGYRISSSGTGYGKIQRLFKPEHPLIKKLRAIYYEPEVVIRDYPKFIELIPKESRDRVLGGGSKK